MQSYASKGNKTYKFLSILIPFAFGYLLTCIFRSVNAVQAPYLVHSLNLSTKDIGLLTSIYFLSFAISQIPLGVLLDRYGPRLIQTVFFLIATVGILIFASAVGVGTLTLGRFVLGIGVSGGLMCAFKANSKWFSDKIPLMNGVVLAFGGAGAMLATFPTQMLINVIGWREFNIILSVATLICALIVFFFVPKEKELATNDKLVRQMFEIIHIGRNRFFWKIAPITMLVLGFFMSVQGLWTTSWLMQVNKLTFSQVGLCLLGVAAAFTLGMFVMGYLGNFFKSKINSLVRFVKIGFLVTLLMETIILFKLDINPYASWFFYAFIAQVGTLGYSLLMIHFPKQYSGRAITALNLGIFLSAFFIQFLIGSMVHYIDMVFNLSVVLSYQITFGFFILLQYMALLWLFLFRAESQIDLL